MQATTEPIAGPAATSGADVYVTDVALAEIFDVSPNWLRQLRCRGDGPPFVKFGRAVRYHVGTARAWAAARTLRSTSELEAA